MPVLLNVRVSKMEGIKEVSVNSVTEQARIILNDSKISLDQISEKINPFGYILENIETDGDIHKEHLINGRSNKVKAG